MTQKKKWTGWIVLSVITVGAAVALASVNLATESQRNEQASLAFETGIRALFPEADEGTDGIVSLQESTSDQNDEAILRYTIYSDRSPIGMVIRSQSAGYAGPVEVLTGIETNGVLRGISVGGTDFQETEGLGSKVKDVSFTQQFVGAQPPLTLGEEIEVISGATISSRAVVNAVNDAYDAKEGTENVSNTETTDPSTTNTGVPEMKGEPVSISTIGYAGPVLVQLRFGDNNEIIAVQVGNERFLETAGIGSQVQEEAFLNQFLDQTPPLSESDIDLISGATISSRAVLEAVNEAGGFINP